MGLGAVFVAAMKEWKRSHEQNAVVLHRRAGAARQSARRRHLPRERGARKAPRLPRDGRLGVALHRPLWHGMGHHEFLHRRSPRPRAPTLRWWRPASPRRCSPRRSACSRPSRRSSPTTSSRATPNKLIGRLEGFADEFSTILSPPARSAGRPVTWRWRLRQRAAGGGGAARRGAQQADERDQRHPDGRRDAGAADRLHGGGAAADGGRADRPAADAGQAAQHREQADHRVGDARRRRSSSATSRCRSRTSIDATIAPGGANGTEERIYRARRSRPPTTAR